MSLYDNISNSLATKGLNNIINSGVTAGLNGVGNIVKQAFGNSTFGAAVANIGTSAARNAALSVYNKYVPARDQKLVNAATNAAGDILRGDFSNAALRALDSGILDGIIPGINGQGTQARYMGTPTPLYGGITPADAMAMYQESRQVQFSQKNLFMLEIRSNLSGDMSSIFNMYCTEMDYTPFTISGERIKVGAGSIDTVQSADQTDLRMTTLDDAGGTIKSWFSGMSAMCAAQDGTVGLPSQYAIVIKVLHSFITADSNRGGFEYLGTFRPVNIEISQSRRENALEELQLSFTQLDTFMPTIGG